MHLGMIFGHESSWVHHGRHHVPHGSDRLTLVSFVPGAELSRAIFDPLNFFTVHWFTFFSPHLALVVPASRNLGLRRSGSSWSARPNSFLQRAELAEPSSRRWWACAKIAEDGAASAGRRERELPTTRPTSHRLYTKLPPGAAPRFAVSRHLDPPGGASPARLRGRSAIGRSPVRRAHEGAGPGHRTVRGARDRKLP